jgi:hypothetical protein
MKTYPYIVIHKDNMSKLYHYKTSDQVSLSLYPKTNSDISDHYIIIKDEKTVIDLTPIKYITADANIIYRRVKEIIDETIRKET